MTCGTPVAAYPSGSMSKVIDEKVYRSAGERPLKCLLKSLIESISSTWQGAARGHASVSARTGWWMVTYVSTRGSWL